MSVLLPILPHGRSVVILLSTSVVLPAWAQEMKTPTVLSRKMPVSLSSMAAVMIAPGNVSSATD